MSQFVDDVQPLQQEWASEQCSIKKFRHLWNLLNRSNLYASALLSVIELKQQKHKKRWKAKMKRQKETKLFGKIESSSSCCSLSNIEDIRCLVECLIDRVVEDSGVVEESGVVEDSGDSVVNKKFEITADINIEPEINMGQSNNVQSVFQSNDTSCKSESSHSGKSDYDEEVDSFFNEESLLETNVDSGLGASDFTDVLNSSYSEAENAFNFETKVEKSLSNDGHDAQTSFNSDVVASLCSEEDYLKSLQSRRGFCSSPKPAEIKQELLTDPLKQEIIVGSTEVILGPHVVKTECSNKTQSNCWNVSDADMRSNEDGEPIMLEEKESKKVDSTSSMPHSCSLEESIGDSSQPSFNSINVAQMKNVKSEENGQSFFNHLELVSCPICEKLVASKIINKHLDICVGRKTKQQSLRKRAIMVKSEWNPHKRPRHCSTTVEKDVDDSRITVSKMNSPQQVTLLPPMNTKNQCEDVSVHDEKIEPLFQSVAAATETLEEDFNLISEDTDCNDDKDDSNSISTGLESIKLALEKTLLSNQTVNKLILEAVAKEAEQNSSLESKVCNDAGFVKRRSGSMEESDVSDSDTDEDVSVEVPEEPTRRSTRSTRSRISYCEANAMSEDEEIDKIPIQKKKFSIRFGKRNKMQLKVEADHSLSGLQDDVIDDAELEIEADNEKQEDDLVEHQEELECIDVEKLLAEKFHNPQHEGNIEDITTKCDLDPTVDPAQPKYLTGGRLREYQITGYQWLKILFENGENGILADEMGLGKTIQSIAIISKLIQSKVKGPFLICAPTSTIVNWFSEFKKFSPQIPLLLYHGTNIEREALLQCLLSQMKLGLQVVVITSYEILIRDKIYLEAYPWSYLIMDEAHRVKNLKSKTFKDMKSFSACSKLMLTGTPLQNDLAELWSLLNFLLPDVFDDIQAFKCWFDVVSIQNNEKVISILHQILTPFLLRRVKSDVDIKIPPKKEVLVMIPLAPLQEKYYRATVDRSIVQLVKDKEYYKHEAISNVSSKPVDEVNKESNEHHMKTRHHDCTASVEHQESTFDFIVNVTLNNMMMQLRKCCNHPYLVRYPIDPFHPDKLKIDEDVVLSSGKMMLLDRMLPRLKDEGHKILLFSQMTSLLDILEDYCALRSYTFLRFDGSTKCDERFQLIEEFNSNNDIFIFLLSTRAGGLGINLTAADTVIIFDSDWNPQNDMQAQDRCHRIGQDRPVVVYRLVTMATIDQQIVERASMKRRLEKLVMHESKFKGNLANELHNPKAINPEELLLLLESNKISSVVENKENIISDEDLFCLLDRSNMNEKESAMKISPTSAVEDLSEVGRSTAFKLMNGISREDGIVM